MLAFLVSLTISSNKTLKLRGVSLSWHNWWPQFHSAKTVDGFKTEFHANVIRTFMGVETVPGYFTDKEGSMKYVYNVIDECIKQKIYGMINFGAFQLHTSAATEFFTTMAKKYAGSPYVIYELCNEPESAPWSEIKKYSETLIKVIRQYDKDNLILVPTPQWDRKIIEAAKDPITIDNNIAYTFHIYTGSLPKSLQTDLRNSYKIITVWANENGAMNNDGKGPLDPTGWAEWINLYEELQVPWLCFGAQDTYETCAIFKSTDSFSDLTDWGKLCKQTILKYQ